MKTGKNVRDLCMAWISPVERRRNDAGALLAFAAAKP
jgi:hypothetical protein